MANLLQTSTRNCPYMALPALSCPYALLAVVRRCWLPVGVFRCPYIDVNRSFGGLEERKVARASFSLSQAPALRALTKPLRKEPTERFETPIKMHTHSPCMKHSFLSMLFIRVLIYYKMIWRCWVQIYLKHTTHYEIMCLILSVGHRRPPFRFPVETLLRITFKSSISPWIEVY